ncbi:MAG: beta-hydroxyacyl-ACP dehydratase [Verrucomicrobia bacterium]|nr:beta-hydroxyacyl-ACP dehydratase [Verrucomicrobiota bacterium]
MKHGLNTDNAPSQQTLLRLAQALAFLPHGPEFRFLDRLTELDPGKSGAGEYRIRGDEPFLRGHFPGCPIFPGVLAVEAAAQLAGVVAQSDPLHSPLQNLKLTAVQNVKIPAAAKPGQTLCLHATISGRLDNLVQATVTAQADGVTILNGKLTLSGG